MAEEAPLKTYRASCHCGAYVYEATLPEVTNAFECNCSVCYKKGVLWQVLGAGAANLRFVKGDPGTLRNYTFGQKRFDHKFCPTCGIALLITDRLAGKEPETWINVRTIQHGQGVDVWKLGIKLFDGKSLYPPAYAPAKFTGPAPQAEVEGGKLYTGSCHCGAVRLAFLSKPLDKTFPENIAECNCSMCGRQGTTWIYPPKEQVVIEGEENLALYVWGEKLWGKTFCKICGVPVHNVLQTISEEQVAKMTENAKKWTVGAAHLKPINLRLFDGVNVKDLNVGKIDGYNIVQPQYVEP
ncbi:glutathione-dependent formaldehyde-activating enzyme [Xylariaceae sp. FL0662B]|nr:glutathione-dependent formaldehyde-activating enzyme [Xylariaceae sp. FL0662B]